MSTEITTVKCRLCRNEIEARDTHRHHKYGILCDTCYDKIADAERLLKNMAEIERAERLLKNMAAIERAEAAESEKDRAERYIKSSRTENCILCALTFVVIFGMYILVEKRVEVLERASEAYARSLHGQEVIPPGITPVEPKARPYSNTCSWGELLDKETKHIGVQK